MEYENDELPLIEMTKKLLNLNFKNINQEIVKKNVEKIADKLSDLDIEKDKHKYLCLSCMYGAFLGDSMGSCCEFSSPSTENHLGIFQYENGIFRPGEVTDDSEMAISASFAYIDIINNESWNVQDLIYYYYCLWRATGPKDIGNANSSALRYWNGNSIIDTKINFSKIYSTYLEYKRPLFHLMLMLGFLGNLYFVNLF